MIFAFYNIKPTSMIWWYDHFQQEFALFQLKGFEMVFLRLMTGICFSCLGLIRSCQVQLQTFFSFFLVGIIGLGNIILTFGIWFWVFNVDYLDWTESAFFWEYWEISSSVVRFMPSDLFWLVSVLGSLRLFYTYGFSFVS